MRYPTDLLYRLARSIGSAELDGTEAAIEVPSALHPILTIPGAFPRRAAFSDTAIQRETFMTSGVNGLTASQAATDVLICTFGRGLWRVRISTRYLSSFTAVSNGTVTSAAVNLRDPVPTDTAILGFIAVNAIPQWQFHEADWLFIEDSWSLRHSISATGVGETHDMRTFISAARLL